MGALPKKKTTSHRRGRRRAVIKLDKTNYQTCAQCGAVKKFHQACPSCGTK